MLNQTMLVGRIASDLQINENENGKKLTTITLEVTRNYKNENGIYETDLIPCILWNTIALSTFEYCKKGDIVGVKGRIQNIEDKMEIIAEKISFLSK